MPRGVVGSSRDHMRAKLTESLERWSDTSSCTVDIAKTFQGLGDILKPDEFTCFYSLRRRRNPYSDELFQNKSRNRSNSQIRKDDGAEDRVFIQKFFLWNDEICLQ